MRRDSYTTFEEHQLPGDLHDEVLVLRPRTTIPENDCVALAVVAAATTALVVLLIAVTCSRGLNSIICPAMYST